MGPSEFESESLAPQARRMVQATPRPRRSSPGAWDLSRPLNRFRRKLRTEAQWIKNQVMIPATAMIVELTIDSQKNAFSSPQPSLGETVGEGVELPGDGV
jgi:hypothetical protein